ncbi:hypothetical protein BJX61DRAFT_217688 [Aspergillus egyptiacus]|nr:hypothetical protein BJX61DRAFT_217688 [Aspergillus egyptiacus]
MVQAFGAPPHFHFPLSPSKSGPLVLFWVRHTLSPSIILLSRPSPHPPPVHHAAAWLSISLLTLFTSPGPKTPPFSSRGICSHTRRRPRVLFAKPPPPARLSYTFVRP